MNATLSKVNIQRGNFNNVVINGDWAAIRYDITTTAGGKSAPGTVMEVVKFKDFGGDQGVRVIEGCGGPKDDRFEAMSMFQTETKKQAQQQVLADVVAYKIPSTTDLDQKYPVKNPTEGNSVNAAATKTAILKDVDAWNHGNTTWAKEACSFHAPGAQLTASDGTTASLDQYEAAVQTADQTTKVSKLYFDTMLISGDWAAVHYRTTTENLATHEKTAGDSMQFFHFVKDGNSVKVDKGWTK